jgi:hypothetical protein
LPLDIPIGSERSRKLSEGGEGLHVLCGSSEQLFISELAGRSTTLLLLPGAGITFRLDDVEVGTVATPPGEEKENRAPDKKLGAAVPTHRNFGAGLPVLLTRAGALEPGDGVKPSLTRFGLLRVAGSWI